MATANSRRGERRSVRASSSSRLRTQPVPTQEIKGESAAKVLIEVRRRLAVAEAIALVVCAALRRQGADADHDAVLALQHCVADEGERQIEEIDRVIALCLALERKSAVSGDKPRARETPKA
jgi:hypothetical protein